MLAGLLSGEAFLPDLQTAASLLCPHTAFPSCACTAPCACTVHALKTMTLEAGDKGAQGTRRPREKKGREESPQSKVT